MATRVRSTTFLFKQVNIVSTPTIEVIVGTPRQMVDAAGPDLRRLGRRRRYLPAVRPPLYDISLDGFGVPLEQPQDHDIIHPILSIRRTTIESGSHWTQLALRSRSIVWSIKHLRGCLWSTTSLMISYYKALETFDKIVENNPRMQPGPYFTIAYKYTLEYHQ